MLNKLQAIKDKFDNIGERLNDPALMNNQRQYAAMNREYKDLQKVVEAYERYKLLLSNITNNTNILRTEKDEEFRELAKSELEIQEAEKEEFLT